LKKPSLKLRDVFSRLGKLITPEIIDIVQLLGTPRFSTGLKVTPSQIRLRPSIPGANPADGGFRWSEALAY
jgi:hypothetical protein